MINSVATMLKVGVPKSLVMRLVARKRAEVANTFLALLHPDKESDICLEIGGPNAVATDILVPYFSRYFIVNINPSELNPVSARPTILAILGDGCQLPFADNSVHFVFSNAVIEHIPRERRRLLAQEVQRVCKRGFFIATPYYWFPFEPHYRMPCFQYAPEVMKRFVLRWVSIGWLNRDNYKRIQLLTLRELKALFPGAYLGNLRSTLVPEIIFAYSYQEQASDWQEPDRE